MSFPEVMVMRKKRKVKLFARNIKRFFLILAQGLAQVSFFMEPVIGLSKTALVWLQ
jgi:hypothetical protein